MKNLFILLLAALALIAFAYFTVFSDPAYKLEQEAQKKAAELSKQTTDSKDKSSKLEPFSGAGSLQSLAQKGQNLECTIKYNNKDASTTVEGTYFTNQGDIRADMLTDSPDLNGKILSSMIIKDNTMYVWSEIEGQKYGVKTDLEQLKTKSVKNTGPVSLQEKVNYECRPWPQVDRTVFDPPSDVLFNDANELIKAGMEDGTIYKEQSVPELP